MNLLQSAFSISANFRKYFLLFFLSTLLCIFSQLFAYSLAHANEEKPLFTVNGIGGGGGFFSPTFSPYNEKLMLVVCDMGGVYRSEDAGKSWQMLHFKTSPRQAQYFADPIFLTKDRVVWVSNRYGISISEDEGRTWKSLGGGPWYNEKKVNAQDSRQNYITSFLPLDKEAKQFLISSQFGLWRGSPNNWEKISDKSSRLLTQVGSDIFYIEEDKTLMHSSDNGRTWNKTSLPGEISTFEGALSENGKPLFYIAINGEGIFRSTDSGKTWQNQVNDCRNIRKIVIPENQSAIVYATEHFYNNVPPNLLRTLDGGETWEAVFIMHDNQETFWRKINVQQSWLQTNLYWSYYLTSVAVSPFDSNLLLASTQGELFVSRNAGETWETFFSEIYPPLDGDTAVQNKSIGLEVTSVWGYHFDPHDPNREYIAYTDIGFARSIDKGEKWSWAAKGSPWTNTFYDVAFDPDIPGKMYAATATLHDIPHYLSISQINPSSRIHQGGVVVSTDYGQTWSVPYNRDANAGLPAQATTSIVIDKTSPKENRTLFASLFGESDDYAGVYISKDNGKTWSLTPSQPGGFNRHIFKLKINPYTGDLFALITGLRAPEPHYFNKEEGGVWISSDQGKTWKHLSKDSPLNHWANDIIFHPTDPKGIYVTAASPQGIRAGGVYYTNDYGERWWHILKDSDINRLTGNTVYAAEHWMSVAVHPVKTNIIFAGGTNYGLFFSVDGGRKWRWYEEFPFSNAQNITFNPHNPDEIIITTFGSGVWSASIKELLSRYNYSYDKIK